MTNQAMEKSNSDLIFRPGQNNLNTTNLNETRNKSQMPKNNTKNQIMTSSPDQDKTIKIPPNHIPYTSGYSVLEGNEQSTLLKIH